MRIAAWTTAPRRAAALAVALLALIGTGAGARADDTLEVQVTREGRLLQVRATFGSATPASTCYAVLADFDRLEEFVPGLRVSEIVSAPGEPIRLHQVGDANAGFFHVALDVTLAVRERPPTRIEFERVAGNLRLMQGSWTVDGDARRCGIAYAADIEPGFWVPPLIGPLLMRNQVEAQLEGVLAELRRRAAASSGTPH